MIRSYSANKYLEHKKVYQTLLEKYKEVATELEKARQDWYKSRDAIRASLTESQLDECVIKCLQEEVGKE